MTIDTPRDTLFNSQVGNSTYNARRFRDFRRGYKACELCRRKKIRCVVEKNGQPCLRCQREFTECIFNTERSFRKRKRDKQTTILDNAGSSRDGSGHEWGSNHTEECDPRDPPTSITQGHLYNLTSPSSTAGYPAERDSGYLHEKFPLSMANIGCSQPQLRETNAVVESSPQHSPEIEAGGHNDDFEDTVIRSVVSNGKDALRVLFQAAVEHSKRDGGDNFTSPSLDKYQANSAATDIDSPNSMKSTRTDGLSALSPASKDVLQVWRSFRFVMMGWFTAEEAVTYIDLFYKNLAPLSPVTSEFDSHHDSHYRLITQEPLLCCVILMISSRYHVLAGSGGLARSTLIHHRLWEHCQHLITRLLFGQEKLSKAKTRTIGSIEALLLIIEWHPRAIQLPPAVDGWDSSLLMIESDPRDDKFANQSDVYRDSDEEQWVRDVITPAKTSDRMSWMLLACAQSLSLELGVCDIGSRGGTHPQHPAQLQSQQTRLRELLYIYNEQQSGRIGCPSMTSESLTRAVAETPQDTNKQTPMMVAWKILTNLMRTIVDVMSPSSVAPRGTMGGSRYMSIIKHFQQQLQSWKTAYLKPEDLSAHAYEDLLIEYNYLRAFMNSMGIQAAVDRILSGGAPNDTDALVLRLSITTTDYAYIKEVIDGSCQILESINRLSRAGTLRFCPVRIFLRLITVSIFLLKALSLGTKTADFQASISTLERTVSTLRACNLDEMHMASRYGELLALHLKRFREGMVPASVPNGAASTATAAGDYMWNQNIAERADGLDPNLLFPSEDQWLALPFDPSLAPFGVSTENTDYLSQDDLCWDILWNLPNV